MAARFLSVVRIAAGVALGAAVIAGQARACSHCMCGTPFPAGLLGGAVPMQITLGIEDEVNPGGIGVDRAAPAP